MKTLSLSHCETIGNKVVLDSGVSLDNVPSLPPHVEVEYITAASLFTGEDGARSKDKDVATVLEGATELGSVDGKSQWFVGAGSNVDVWVLRNGRSDTCSPVRNGNMHFN